MVCRRRKRRRRRWGFRPLSLLPPLRIRKRRGGGGGSDVSELLSVSLGFFGGRDLLSLFRRVGKGGEPASSPSVGGSFVRIGCLSEDADGWGRIWDGKRRAWGMGSREEKSPYEVPREGGPLLLPFLPLGPSFPFLARGSIRGSGEKGSSSGYWYTTVWACREEAPFLERGDASVVRALGSPEGERGYYAGMRKNRPKQTRASSSSSSPLFLCPCPKRR